MKNSSLKFLATHISLIALMAIAPLGHSFAESKTDIKTTDVHNVKYSLANIIEPLLPSVVNISTTSEVSNERSSQGMGSGSPLEELLRQFLEEGPGGGRNTPQRKSASLGSGVLIGQKPHKDTTGKNVTIAYIATCYHVIAGADEIKIKLHEGEQEFKAEIVGIDRRTDLAVLKIITDKAVQVAEWGDSSKMRVGDLIIAIGNPFGLSSTVTTGIASTLARDIGASSGGVLTDFIDSYIQTDASINMGNSGGPMFNAEGKIVAISTAIFSPNGGSIGLGFGIPSDFAKLVIDQLIAMGRTKRGWLGVKVQPVTPEIAEALGLSGKTRGALVRDITPKSPAAQLGLKTGDIILKFNNIDIKESRNLPRIVGDSPVGKELPIVVWRDNKEQMLKINVGEFETAEAEGLIDNGHEEKVKINKQQKVLGMVVQTITPPMRERYRLPENLQGTLIVYVDQLSEAAEKGLRPGDIITDALSNNNKVQITSTGDFHKFIDDAKKAGRANALFIINRRGNSDLVTLNVNEGKSSDKATIDIPLMPKN